MAQVGNEKVSVRNCSAYVPHRLLKPRRTLLCRLLNVDALYDSGPLCLSPSVQVVLGNVADAASVRISDHLRHHATGLVAVVCKNKVRMVGKAKHRLKT